MRFCTNRLKMLLVALILAANLVVAMNGTVYADTPSSGNLPKVYIVTNGVEMPVEEGAMLGKAGRGLTVSFELNEQYNRGYVQGEYTKEGNLKITEIEFWHTDVLESAISKEDGKYPTIIEGSVSGEGTKLQSQGYTDMASTLAGTNTRAWAKSTILCPFGVTATEVYSEVNYVDYGTSLSTINALHDFYDSALAYLVWWQVSSARSSTSTESWTLGKFDSNAPGNQLHTHTAKVVGHPGNHAHCYFTLDRLPDWIVPGVKFTWHTDGQLVH